MSTNTSTLTVLLLSAIRLNDDAQVDRLIAAGAPVNPIDGDQIAPLSHAVENAAIKCVELLLSAGADPNIGHWTPLQNACDKGFGEIANLLLDHGANPLLRDSAIEPTAAHVLLESYSKYKDQENGVQVVANLLIRMLEGKRRANLTYGAGTSLLNLAIGGFAHRGILSTLSFCGANLSQRNKAGFDPIHFAAMQSNLEAIDFLVQFGIDVNAYDGEGLTPLHYCVTAEAVQALINHGAEIDQVDSFGRTPLGYRLANTELKADLGAISALISAGADPNVAALDGTTPNSIAKSRGLNKVKALIAAQQARTAMQNVGADARRAEPV